MTGRWVAAASCAALLLAMAAPLVRADEHEIAIVDGGFEPSTLTVFTGEPVTWTNRTTVDHAVLTEDGLLDSGPIGPGEAFGHIFEEPGTVEYYVGGNPRIRATIVVKQAPVTEPPSGSQPPTPPAGTLPPDFSPMAPRTEPPTPSATAIPAQTVVVTLPPGPPSETSSGNGPALFLAVAVVGAIAIGAAMAALIGASRRPGR